MAWSTLTYKRITFTAFLSFFQTLKDVRNCVINTSMVLLLLQENFFQKETCLSGKSKPKTAKPTKEARLMNEVKQETVNASLDNIAQMWVNILLAQIQSKKEQKKLGNNDKE